VDSRGKANEEGSADSAIRYFVVLNYDPQLISCENREQSCCYLWQRLLFDTTKWSSHFWYPCNFFL